MAGVEPPSEVASGPRAWNRKRKAGTRFELFEPQQKEPERGGAPPAAPVNARGRNLNQALKIDPSFARRLLPKRFPMLVRLEETAEAELPKRALEDILGVVVRGFGIQACVRGRPFRTLTSSPTPTKPSTRRTSLPFESKKRIVGKPLT